MKKLTDRFSRTELLFGKDNMEKLKKARVAVFGIGGVGGYTVEALARSGVGALDLIDSDRVTLTNLNRQIVALESTLGMYKTEAARARILDINPECSVTVYNTFYLPENAAQFDLSQYSYIVDAVDTVTAKIEIVVNAQAAGVPVISAMGAGNKLCAAAFEVADIYKTHTCPLAKVMRRELRKRGVKKLKTVYSAEEPLSFPAVTDELHPQRRSVPGSVSFVPSVAGLIIGGEVIKDLLEI